MVRIALALLATSVAVATPAVGILNVGSDRADVDLAIKREEEIGYMLVSDDDDDDGDSRDSFTSGVDSNDRTNSRHTPVSRDRDRSRGDLTRDRTRDGKGDKQRRDWSKNRTNDRSRNDSR